jgi:hypothetical protein
VSEGDRPSWWQTLPGVLTAIAGVITAVTGLIVGVYQSGLIKPSRSDTVTASSSPSAPSEPGSSAGAASPLASSPPPSSPSPGAPASSSSRASTAAAAPAPTSASASVPALTGPKINLLASENGGHLVAASDDNWKYTIDGDEGYHCCYYLKQYAVYAFKGGKEASFDMFASFVDATRPDNAHELEVAVGNDSPLGEFKTIAKCEFQNVKLFETPYQECKFPATRAKYFRVMIVSTFGSSSAFLDEFKLLGTVN